jgi:hypothetical protein
MAAAIRRVLIETATGANKQLWATVACKHCGRAGRYEITVPDNKVRLDAVQAVLHESLGRPRQAETQTAPTLPRTVAEARALSWDQLSLVFATQFATEITSVMNPCSPRRSEDRALQICSIPAGNRNDRHTGFD